MPICEANVVVSHLFNLSFKYFAPWKSMCLVHGGSDHFVKPKSL